MVYRDGIRVHKQELYRDDDKQMHPTYYFQATKFL